MGRAAILALLGATLALWGKAEAKPAEMAQAWAERVCPAGLDPVAQCWEGQDRRGAWLLAAMPRNWNRRLIVHGHGGPRLDPPKAGDGDEDLARFASGVEAGYAWIATSYHRPGFGVRAAGGDLAQARRLFVAQFGRPRLTILHGQSWGGQVVAKTIEIRGLREGFDGVLTTNGVMAGGTRAYGFRADLRVVYQAICANHPAPEEAPYPLWQGLPADSRLTRGALRSRFQACTGQGLDAAVRTPQQTQNLADLVQVTGIQEDHLLTHLNWATFTFPSLIATAGGNPFDNRNTVYRGSADDQALNARAQRFAADPRAVRRLAFDADPTGRLRVPLLSLHGRHDPTAGLFNEFVYRDIVRTAGHQQYVLQVVTRSGDHALTAPALYVAALNTLATWIETGQRPRFETLLSQCMGLREGQGPSPACAGLEGLLPEAAAPPTASPAP